MGRTIFEIGPLLSESAAASQAVVKQVVMYNPSGQFHIISVRLCATQMLRLLLQVSENIMERTLQR